MPRKSHGGKEAILVYRLGLRYEPRGHSEPADGDRDHFRGL